MRRSTMHAHAFQQPVDVLTLEEPEIVMEEPAHIHHESVDDYGYVGMDGTDMDMADLE